VAFISMRGRQLQPTLDLVTYNHTQQTQAWNACAARWAPLPEAERTAERREAIVRECFLLPPAPHAMLPVAPAPAQVYPRGPNKRAFSGQDGPGASSGPTICRQWNQLTGCRFKDCRYEHACNNCGERLHGAAACPHQPIRGSTAVPASQSKPKRRRVQQQYAYQPGAFSRDFPPPPPPPPPAPSASLRV
jgi:hypothetical protein